jgi:hypothetical protein
MSYSNRKKETAMMKELRRREAADHAPRMSIVYRAVDQLKLDPANARRHSKKQIRQIAESIKTFGFNVPILIDHDGKVVAGHGRLLACRLLGMTEVPTLCLDHLTAAQARAFMIADNRLTEIATWDDRLLAQQLKELSLSGLDFNIEVTGFEMARSICGSHPSTTRSRPPMTRQIGCPTPRPCHRSAKSEIYGFSVPTTSCAAMPEIPQPSPP